MNCIVCLEEDNNLIKPKFCSCKIFLHEQCLKKCYEYKIYCPICRIKKFANFNNITGVNQIERFGEQIFNNFINNPNLTNFLIFFILSMFYTVFYIAPLALYYFIKNKYFE